RISCKPPASMSISMRVAPASSAFSASSLTTEAARSMTSPAAIWSIRALGRTRIGMRGPGQWDRAPVYTPGASGAAAPACRRIGIGHVPLAGKCRPVGRMQVKISGQARADGVGEPLLILPGPELALLARIGNIGSLHQHRGNVRGLEYHEAGLLHLLAADGADPIERRQHPVGDLNAGADAVFL